MIEGPGAASAAGLRVRRLLAAALAAIGILRLATLGVIPLLDRSEARYAEIGRVMLASGNWVTPQLAPGVPFWGKPPLHFWATALSLQAFGASAFSARLPSWLGALAVLWVTWLVARRMRGALVAWLACIVLASSALFYTLAAQVSLDLTLAACITSALGAQLLARLETDAKATRRWLRLAFVALGAGLLAKGPVAVVLWLGTLALAALIERDWRWWRGQPWLSGIALAAVVSVPWYWMAERSTPGFLDYFLVHENFLRYFMSDYGDRYGHGHVLPYGTIWGFALAALLPWSPAMLALVWRDFLDRRDWLGARNSRLGALARLRADPARAFLWAWSLAPLCFFTLSRSVVVTYVLPAIPPMALLLADALVPRTHSPDDPEASAANRRLLPASLLVGVGIVLAGVTIGAAVISRRIPVPGFALTLLGALLAAMGVALWRCSRSARPLALVAAAALCIPLVDAGGRALLGCEIGALGSTRDLARSFEAHQREAACELAFFHEAPFSARFYLGMQPATLKGDVEKLRVLASAPECRLVALHQRQLRELAEGALAGLHPVRDFGAYVLYGNARAGRAEPASELP